MRASPAVPTRRPHRTTRERAVRARADDRNRAPVCARFRLRGRPGPLVCDRASGVDASVPSPRARSTVNSRSKPARACGRCRGVARRARQRCDRPMRSSCQERGRHRGRRPVRPCAAAAWQRRDQRCLDVLVVEHHCPAPPPDREELRSDPTRRGRCARRVPGAAPGSDRRLPDSTLHVAFRLEHDLYR